MIQISKICELRVIATCILGAALGSDACSAPAENPALEDVRPSEQKEPLKGGNVTNAWGVVSYSNDLWNCTGSMIAPNAVLTAAHCFNGIPGDGGPLHVTIWYHDPIRGKRQVFSGQATFNRYPYVGSRPDIAVITVPGVFTETDYHDYKRLLGSGNSLPSSQRFYGAGRFNDTDPSDGQLRTHALTVQDISTAELITDNGNGIAVCHGDSGGPLNVVASTTGHPDSLELISGILSQADANSSGDACASESYIVPDNGYFARPCNFVNWIASTIGHTCSSQSPGANYPYQRCFDLNFVEDIDFEGQTQGEEVAMLTAIQVF